MAQGPSHVFLTLHSPRVIGLGIHGLKGNIGVCALADLIEKAVDHFVGQISQIIAG